MTHAFVTVSNTEDGLPVTQHSQVLHRKMLDIPLNYAYLNEQLNELLFLFVLYFDIFLFQFVLKDVRFVTLAQ